MKKEKGSSVFWLDFLFVSFGILILILSLLSRSNDISLLKGFLSSIFF